MIHIRKSVYAQVGFVGGGSDAPVSVVCLNAPNPHGRPKAVYAHGGAVFLLVLDAPASVPKIKKSSRRKPRPLAA